MGVVDYIKATQGEMRHVSWPSRKQVVLFTSAVVVVSLVVAVALGIFDFVFLRGLRAVIGGDRSIQTATTSPQVEFTPELMLNEAPVDMGSDALPSDGLEGGLPPETDIRF